MDPIDNCSGDTVQSLTTAGFSESQIAALCSGILSTDVTGLSDGVNAGYLILSGALVFVMHAGFAMLCAGAIRSKNTMNILLQTILDACVSAIAFYTVGFAFAYGSGNNPNGFIGDALFGLSNYSSHSTGSGIGKWQDWFFQWAFAATATTIPAGCVAERFNFNAYLGYSLFISAWIYPVVVHWIWSGTGWLSYLNAEPLIRSGMIDFAGSGVVHMTGGFSGLMGCILVGPRLGRFDSNGKPVDMPGHSATLVVLGTVLLWFGWYGFNPGSVLIIGTSNTATVAARAAVTTTLCGASGGLTSLALSFIRHKAWDLISVCNGVLVGFVSITASANVVEPWAAICSGIVGACIFELVCWLFLKLQIDDPLSAAPMHGFCGIWGVIFPGLLANKNYVAEAYGRDGPYGLFYPGGGARLLVCQITGIACILAWVCGQMFIFFFIFKLLKMLRISAEEEQAGLDASKHGGSAYNFDHGVPGKGKVEAHI